MYVKMQAAFTKPYACVCVLYVSYHHILIELCICKKMIIEYNKNIGSLAVASTTAGRPFT